MTIRDMQALTIVREQLTVAETRIYEHITETFRWLMATLFAANGGAIIALISWDDFTVSADRVPLGCFTVGLLVSILIGS